MILFHSALVAKVSHKQIQNQFGEWNETISSLLFVTQANWEYCYVNYCQACMFTLRLQAVVNGILKVQC